MSAKNILAFDLGTGGNKATLFDPDGTLLASAFVAYPTLYPASGFHEQRPRDWYKAVSESSRKLLTEAKIAPDSVGCLALSGHSLGCVPMDKDGNLLREQTPIWSDSRAAKQAEKFFEKFDASEWYLRTGNGFPAGLYTLFKTLWYAENEPETFRKTAKIIGTKDYINYRLTGRIATDYSYASGSGCYRLTEWRYDDEILAASGLDPNLFPEIFPSTEILGNLTPQAAEDLGLTTNVLVASGGVDNSCMALGAGCNRKGKIYASLGSSSWIALTDDAPLLDKNIKPYVFTHLVPGMFTSAIGMFSSGTTFRWVRDQLCADLVAEAARENKEVYDLMTALAQTSPVGAKGLLMNPALAGGSSFDPSPLLRGGFVNLDLLHTRADMVRAAMEGITLGTRVLLDTICKLAATESKMPVVGGGGNSPFWCQMYADVLNRTIEKPTIGQNAASLGAAAAAAVGAGIWDSFDRIEEKIVVNERFVPNSENTALYEKILVRFQYAAELLAQYGEKKFS